MFCLNMVRRESQKERRWGWRRSEEETWATRHHLSLSLRVSELPIFHRDSQRQNSKSSNSNPISWARHRTRGCVGTRLHCAQHSLQAFTHRLTILRYFLAPHHDRDRRGFREPVSPLLPRHDACSPNPFEFTAEQPKKTIRHTRMRQMPVTQKGTKSPVWAVASKSFKTLNTRSLG